MNPVETVVSIKPSEAIWGFHCHQELPEAQFPQALVIQQRLVEYLRSENIDLTADAFLPGYGPHILPMWELRVETSNSDTLKKLGLAAMFLFFNRSELSGHIHPLMHNNDVSDDLLIEGTFNQPNALWFGYKVEQNQDFFFNPPRNSDGSVVDTRNPRLLTRSQQDQLKSQAAPLNFYSPEQLQIVGFDLWLDFASNGSDRKTAEGVLHELIQFGKASTLELSTAELIEPGRHIPFKNGGCRTRLCGDKANLTERLGLLIGWLMCNRQGINICLVPCLADRDISWSFKHCLAFIGTLPEYNLDLF